MQDPRGSLMVPPSNQLPDYATILMDIKRRSMGGDTSISERPAILGPLQTTTPAQLTDRRRSGEKDGRSSRPSSPSEIKKRAERSLEQSNQRLKTIEDHMWQHRQEERDLRRAENDISRQQKHMQHVMRSYESKIRKQKEGETQSLLTREAQHSDYLQKDLHHKEEATKSSIQVGHTQRQKFNEHTKKFMKNVNEMTWRYRNLLQLLQKKQSEMEHLSGEFESRARSKEEEQHSLKQQLSSLAISLNMEAQKRRHIDVEQRQQQSHSAMKQIQDSRMRTDLLNSEERARQQVGVRHEDTQRQLDQDLIAKQEKTRTRQRQEGHNLADAHTKLARNQVMQQFMHDEVDHLRLEMARDESKERVEVAAAKRRNKLDSLQSHTKEKNAKEMQQWADRAVKQESESRRRQNGDRLKKLSKQVGQQDHVEHSLYTQARSYEATCSKQSQIVIKMQLELDNLKRENAHKLKAAAVQAQTAEQELQQKILKETAKLAHIGNQREECLRSLTVQRNRTREDRKMLEDERRENQRRTRIAQRSKLHNSLLAS